MNRKFFTVPHLFKILFMLGLAVTVHLAYVTSFYVVLGNNYASTPEMNFDAYIHLIPIIVIATLILADILQMPRFFRKKNIDVVSQSLVFSTILTLVTLSAKDLLVQRAFPRSVILLSYIVLIIYVFTWEMICSIISHKLYENGELVIIGASDHTIQTVMEKINPSLKSLDLNMSEPIKYQDRSAIRAAVRRQAEIFICPDVPEDAKSEIILMCAKQRTVAYIVPQFYEISLYRSRLINLNDLMVFLLDRMALSFEQRLIKRTFDIIFSVLAIILTSPFMLFAAIGTKVSSKGPVFFKQERLTIDNKPYNIIKFRTMIQDAESKTGAVISGKNDPRVTKFGKLLRRTKIDELPQFFNVLVGDMSVVGPRPCVEYELGDFDTLNKRYKKRFQVKAGLTGLAQTMGRNDNSWDNKVTYDNQYVDAFKKIGVLIDIKILWNSVIKVSKKENIYENKADESMTDAEAAKYEEEEIIRIAHLPD